MFIIGLTGAAGAGKDTATRFILDAVPGAKRQGFADKLKLSAARLFYPECTVEQAIDWCDWLKVNGGVAAYENAGVRVLRGLFTAHMSGRQFLQRYGTEAHRDVFGEDFWLDAVLPPDRDDCPLLVIPDVRFENEAIRVHARAGVIWKVVRPDSYWVEAHTSEAGIPDALVNTVITNDGTLEQLNSVVRSYLVPE